MLKDYLKQKINTLLGDTKNDECKNHFEKLSRLKANQMVLTSKNCVKIMQCKKDENF